MDDGTKQTLQAELTEVVRQRDQLDVVIRYMSDRLGVPVPSAGSPSQQAEHHSAGAVDHHADPAASVRDGEFFGMSSPEASRLLLEKFGRTRPMKTDEIFAAITKGGVKIQNPPTLYRSLTRDATFLRVGRGVWGLAEWYPASARKSAPPNGDESDPEPPLTNATEEPLASESNESEPQE